MDCSIRLGRALYATGMGVLGVQALLRSTFVPALEPVPPWLPHGVLLLVLAWLGGVVLVASGAALLLGWKMRQAAIMLGLLLLLWVVLLHLPALVARPRSGGEWTGACETLALSGSAWVLAGVLGSGQSVRHRADRLLDRAARAGRLGFSLCLPVFGVLHFIYIDYVAGVIPGWIPGPTFWGYFTGAAHIAAGLAIVSGIRARLAAVLLGVMFGSWVLILHIPRVAVRLEDPNEWCSLLIATALCGGAWLIAGTLPAQRTAAG